MSKWIVADLGGGSAEIVETEYGGRRTPFTVSATRHMSAEAGGIGLTVTMPKEFAEDVVRGLELLAMERRKREIVWSSELAEYDAKADRP